MSRNPGDEEIAIIRQIGGGGGWHGEDEDLETEQEDVKGCAIIPRGSEENTDRSNTVITGLTVFAPFKATRPLPTEKVGARGKVWQVTGDVGEYINKAGRGRAVQFALERVTG